MRFDGKTPIEFSDDTKSLEETKFKLKLSNPNPSNDDTDMGELNNLENELSSSNEKPFNDEPFDANVDADENSDPKHFIQQLAGKLGQSLRKYNKDLNQPDYELEKFAINSVISATHTGQMDTDDQNDIIKQIKKSGQNTGNDIDVNVDVDGKSVDSEENSDGNGSESDNSISNEEDFNFGESLEIKLKKRIFVENLNNEDMNEPQIQPKPIIKPSEEPIKIPRRKKPWVVPTIKPGSEPAPKAKN